MNLFVTDNSMFNSKKIIQENFSVVSGLLSNRVAIKINNLTYQLIKSPGKEGEADHQEGG